MPNASTSNVTIGAEGEGFSLRRDTEPYFVKGARTLGTRYMDRVAACGGNGVRISTSRDTSAVLDEAHRLGLSVLLGLPMRAQRDGFDYGDASAVRAQHERAAEIVQAHKDHPALLLWAIGNELDHIPGDKDFDLRLWDAVNDVARMIHQADPNHPAMTVIGTGRKGKLAGLVERCPDLDLLGVNAYADIVEVPAWLRSHGWNRPYAVTEWGPSGHWEVPRTRWGAVIEESSTEKGRVYRDRYEQVIQADPWCVGSYAFLWAGNRQERTHTWYNMFADDGARTEPVEVMQYEWTGQWPATRCPRIAALRIDGQAAGEDVCLAPASVHRAELTLEPASPPVDRIEWELVPENLTFGAYAGQGETKPAPVADAVRAVQAGGRSVEFQAPAEAGRDYRLFVHAYNGPDHVAIANIPFRVEG